MLQCIKYRPSLSSIISWIICNKGSRVTPTLMNLHNTIVPNQSRCALNETEANTSDVFSKVLQVNKTIFHWFLMFVSYCLLVPFNFV
jgi:hypothetical protein